jgi:hypothetical protein
VGSTGSAGTPAWCHAVPTDPPACDRGRTADIDGREPGCRGSLARRNAPLAGRPHDREVAAGVGAVHPHAGAGQPGQQPGGGVTVGVVRADRDQCGPGAAGRQEFRIGVGAAVVGHLQHVGAQVDAGRDDPGLRLGAEVAGEEDAQPPVGDPRDQGQVVRFGRPRRPVGVGCQYLDLDTADGAAVSRHEDRALRAAAADQCVEGGQAMVDR